MIIANNHCQHVPQSSVNVSTWPSHCGWYAVVCNFQILSSLLTSRITLFLFGLSREPVVQYGGQSLLPGNKQLSWLPDLGWPTFWPFGEVVCSHENVLTPSICNREWTTDIHCNCVKWPPNLGTLDSTCHQEHSQAITNEVFRTTPADIRSPIKYITVPRHHLC